MFKLGFVEILIVLLVVIVFVNPKDLPSFLRKLVKLFGQAKDIYNSSIKYIKGIEKEIENTDLDMGLNRVMKYKDTEDNKPVEIPDDGKNSAAINVENKVENNGKNSVENNEN